MWGAALFVGLLVPWMVFAFVFGRSYSTAPFSTLYLFGRGQDIGFQKAIDNSPRKRHHVRFWGMPFARPEAALDTPQFWLTSGRPAEDERVLWVGAGTKDIGFSLTWLSFQVTHATDADTNAERDFLVAELLGHGVIRDTATGHSPVASGARPGPGCPGSGPRLDCCSVSCS